MVGVSDVFLKGSQMARDGDFDGAIRELEMAVASGSWVSTKTPGHMLSEAGVYALLCSPPDDQRASGLFSRAIEFLPDDPHLSAYYTLFCRCDDLRHVAFIFTTFKDLQPLEQFVTELLVNHPLKSWTQTLRLLKAFLVYSNEALTERHHNNPGGRFDIDAIRARLAVLLDNLTIGSTERVKLLRQSLNHGLWRVLESKKGVGLDLGIRIAQSIQSKRAGGKVRRLQKQYLEKDTSQLLLDVEIEQANRTLLQLINIFFEADNEDVVEARGHLDALRDQRVSLGEEKAKLLERWAMRDYKVRARPSQEEVTFDQVAAAMPAGGLLVEVFWPETASSEHLDVFYYDASQRQLKWDKWDKAGVLRAQRKLREIIREIQSAKSDDRARILGATYDRAVDSLHHLYELTVRRALAACGEDVEVLYISPDGPLYYIPWAVLRPHGGTALYRRYGVRVVHGGKALLHPPAVVAELSAGLVAISDFDLAPDEAYVPEGPEQGPTTIRSASSQAAAARRYRTLAQAAVEAERVRTRLTGSGFQITEASEGFITKRRVRDTLEGKRVGHFATHGGFLGSSNEETEVVQLLDRTMMVLSGINLCKDMPETLREEQVVFASELAEWNLHGMELLALSACDTGIGPVIYGDGMASLHRAAAQAGVRTVLHCMWALDDEYAPAFMAGFYDKVGVDFSEAMRLGIDSAIAELMERNSCTERRIYGHPWYEGVYALSGH